jgi:Domain of unknown function (DUF5666)
MKTSFLRHIVISIAILVVMVLFSACSGLGNGQSTLTGSIVSVNPNGTVVVSVNGQQDTIKNVPANVIQLLQNQVGKIYTVQVTTNSDGSFSIVSGSNVTLDNNEGTPTTDETTTSNETPTTTNEPGSIEFYGSVQSAGNNSLVVSMPNSSTLSLTTNSSTDLGDFNNTLPAVNTQVKVDVTANTDGSFTATKIGNVDSANNTTQASFTGVTTAAVGSDHMIHFTVGNRSFSFLIASTANLSDFNSNAQSIQSGANVKITVQFNGSTASAIEVKMNSGN